MSDTNESMTAPADATSRMPYGFGGGQWTYPAAGAASTNQMPHAEVITNGVSWTCDGPVIDLKASRAMAAEQDV